MTLPRAGAARLWRRPASFLRSDDSGSAIVEFLGLALLLLLPLVYVLITVFSVQRAAYADSSASREAARVYVAAESAADGEARAAAAVDIVLRDSGLTPGAGAMEVSCSARPCLTPGATVTVVLSHEVTLPLAPPFLDADGPATVPVTGEHMELVDRYRQARP